MYFEMGHFQAIFIKSFVRISNAKLGKTCEDVPINVAVNSSFHDLHIVDESLKT